MSASVRNPVVLDWTSVWLEIETLGPGARNSVSRAWLKGKPGVKVSGADCQGAALNLARKVYWPRDAGLPKDWIGKVALVHAGARGAVRTFKTRLKMNCRLPIADCRLKGGRA